MWGCGQLRLCSDVFAPSDVVSQVAVLDGGEQGGGCGFYVAGVWVDVEGVVLDGTRKGGGCGLGVVWIGTAMVSIRTKWHLKKKRQTFVICSCDRTTPIL